MFTYNDENELLSIEQVCEKLFISHTTAYKLLQSGFMPHSDWFWAGWVKGTNALESIKLAKFPFRTLGRSIHLFGIAAISPFNIVGRAVTIGPTGANIPDEGKNYDHNGNQSQ